jgi:hypothetical protein
MIQGLRDYRGPKTFHLTEEGLWGLANIFKSDDFCLSIFLTFKQSLTS